MWRPLARGLGALILFIPLCFAAVELDVSVFDARDQALDLDELASLLAAEHVVFIGENHDRYDHHLMQLEVIRRLHAQNPDRWILGLEFFQRRFQPHLDSYIAGTLTEREFLTRTEYFERWGYDYRLYRPIFQYAREHGITLLALNAERELTRSVSETGLVGMPASQRALLPEEIDKSDTGYRDRLRAVFEQHPGAATRDFERFLEVQLVWDETMAERIADYLETHPDKAMIVLAGSGHIAFGSGIPNRVKRRLPDLRSAILLPADEPDADRQEADYLLVSSSASLPPTGRMGVVMDFAQSVTASEIAPGGAAAEAGLEPGDRIMAIDEAPVESLTDLRLALMDTEPGQSVSVRIERDGTAGTRELSLHLTLQ